VAAKCSHSLRFACRWLSEILSDRGKFSMVEKMPIPSTAHYSHKSKPDWTRRVVWGGIASLLFCIVILSLPVALRHNHGSSDRTEAVHNARQTGVVLLDFEKTYGSFPSDDTAALVTKAHPDHGYDLSGKSSNAGGF
jgi:hypothetical protein